MNVSVVICTCNRYEPIVTALESVIANSRAPFETIVVDQSDDRHRMDSLLRGLPFSRNLQVVHDDKKGLSRARNIGWKRARGDVVAFTDDDVLVDRGWIEGILQSFGARRFRTGITGGKIIPVFHEINSKWRIPEQWQYLYPAYDRGDYIGEYKDNKLPPGANFSILRSLLVAVGGFNERLGVIEGRKLQIYGEDCEVALKAQELGYQVIYNSSIVVYHPVPLSRQNQDFLNRRLYIEGVTQMYLYLTLRKPPLWKKVVLLFMELRRLVLLVTIGRIRCDRRVYLGRKNNIAGKMYIIFIKGILGVTP